MEAFGIMGFIFGLGALGKIIMLEWELKESGVLKEQTEANDKWFLTKIIIIIYGYQIIICGYFPLDFRNGSNNNYFTMNSLMIFMAVTGILCFSS